MNKVTLSVHRVIRCSFITVFLLWLLGPQIIQAQLKDNAYRIRSIEIQGTQNVDPAAVLSQLKIKAGIVKESEIDQAVKKLYRMGFFDQVVAKVKYQDEHKRGGVLVFDVVEKPLVRKIYVTGNKEVDESELSKALSLTGKRFLDKNKLRQLIKNAQLLYQSKGYYDATLDYSIVPVDESQVDITFRVEEGKRYKIREIKINGLKTVDPDDLLSIIQTKRYKWWSSWIFGTGRLNQEMLENDRNLMRQYFFDHGYIDVSISDPAIEKRGDGIYITFDINEGRQYKIGQVKVSGDLIDGSEEKTLEGIKTHTGDIFNASQLRNDAFKISDKFADLGYAFANVVPNTRIRRDSAEVDVEFVIDKGKPVTVNQIKIRGNRKTYDNVIRRELRIAEQDLYSGSKIKRSQELLERTGYFEEVNISTENTDRDDQVDLVVNVREASTGTFSAGAGYSSSDGALFNTRLSENNLFGTGRRLTLNLDIGSQRDNLILSFRDRRVNDTFWSAGVDALMTEREFRDFDRKLTGGGVEVGYPLEEFFSWGQDVSFSMRYEYLEIDIRNVDPTDAAQLVIDSQGRSSVSGITPRLVRNTINNPLNPTDGSRQELSFEITGLGGEEKYYLLQAKQQFYYPLLKGDWGDLVFSWRTKFGYGETFDGDPFPLFRRFFPGGINSVRGFESRTLGPKDKNGNEFGGSKQFVNNLELIFPLIPSAGLKGVVFYDAGQAFDDNESFDFAKLRQAYGYGIRWISPLGPIRIEFGFPIDREEGESSMVTLFAFGAPF
ncbi:MAG: outer membrane protein assembly factor BamA [Candidatus Dadabacteria bacterium]|nr:MAG: outer membrane protein assembly factor BamA [Candidatus Dadabacteria bacterium]